MPENRDISGHGGFTLELELGENREKSLASIYLTNHDNDAELDLVGGYEARLKSADGAFATRARDLQIPGLPPHSARRVQVRISKPKRITDFHLPLPLHFSHWSYSGRVRRAAGYVTIDAVVSAGRREAALTLRHESFVHSDARVFLSCEGSAETIESDDRGNEVRRRREFSLRKVRSGDTGRFELAAATTIGGSLIHDVRLALPLRCWYEK